jgi:two-component system, chemotaxis family, chemotaxis protein CheY
MARVRILVADDADFMYEMLENLIDKNRFEVVGYAGDGEEAVKKFKELTPDLVTMDILMPRMNGIKSIKEMRRLNPKARVLVISALSDPDLVKEAMAAGASDYITKPFSVSDLKARILKVTEART